MELNRQTRKPSSGVINDADLQRDLKKFRDMAIALGASAADVIPASNVVVDERVWMKCLVPRCRGLQYGGTPYCPPNTPKPDFMRKVFGRYHWAVLFKRDIENIEDYIPTSEAQIKELRSGSKMIEGYHDKTFEIVGRLESYAQSDGYYVAMGFAGGSCRFSLCRGATCGVIENGNCRFPLQARPSMEAVGIDVFGLASKVGWNVYMIRRIEPDLSAIPCAVSVGIVFIY